MDKRVFQACAALLVAAGGVAAPLPAAAFGPAGHRIAGLLAEPQLCPAARAEVATLGGGESLAELGVWADAIREQPAYNHSAPWHYLNVPDPPPGIAGARAAIRAYRHPPEGDVLSAIERFGAELADRSLSAERRGEALRFLVHFVVDVHQPLHVGRAEDRGGNTVDVRYGVTVVNLHRFWDTEVLELRRIGPQRYARRLEPVRAAAEAAGAPADWAAESLELRPVVYAFAVRKPIELDAAYVATAQRVTEERLVLAASRLAATLNEALCAVNR